MSRPEPIIISEAELDWESWDDPAIAAAHPNRWKLLITGERGPEQWARYGHSGMSNWHAPPPSPSRARGNILCDQRPWTY